MAVTTRPWSIEDAHEEGTDRVPGELGIWLFVMLDMVVFGLLFAIFLHHRGNDPALFDASQAQLHRTFGAVNTMLLLTSSLCVVLGMQAIRLRHNRLARRLLTFAIVLGFAFLCDKWLEWSSLYADGVRPADNHYFLYFFTLTILHAVHVAVGMCGLGYLIAFSKDENPTRGKYMFAESCGIFWHMVDLIWLVLFALLYLMH